MTLLKSLTYPYVFRPFNYTIHKAPTLTISQAYHHILNRTRTNLSYSQIRAYAVSFNAGYLLTAILDTYRGLNCPDVHKQQHGIQKLFCRPQSCPSIVYSCTATLVRHCRILHFPSLQSLHFCESLSFPAFATPAVFFVVRCRSGTRQPERCICLFLVPCGRLSWLLTARK